MNLSDKDLVGVGQGDKKIVLSYDKELNIAVGNSRQAKTWKNISTTWSNLIARLSETVKTPETMSEYKKMQKSDRDRTKDVGGFVGGTLKGGRRKAGNVGTRSLITLDVDFADDYLWDTISMLLDCSCAMYPTHSSTPEKPRYRLLIPTDRPVLSDEYQAISRKIADIVGIDMFDDSTYQPSRLMYWPSCPRDAEYKLFVQDRPFLRADEVLGMYPDWKDVSYWPESSRATADFSRRLKHQQDPTEKNGVIGTFCRAYSITEAIDTFLSDVYEPCDSMGGEVTRYSYKEGSTSGGVVIYDNLFCYSNHATDPASNLLCNAFDIVRMHRFYVPLIDGDGLDEDKARKQSMRDMKTFAVNDAKVKRQVAEERKEACRLDFGVISSEEEALENWEELLSYDEYGALDKSALNVRLILENAPDLKGTIQYDSFADKVNVLGQLPWRKEGLDLPWGDSDISGLKCWLDERYTVRRADGLIQDVLAVYLMNHSVHPIREYLQGLEWDGDKRIETLFIDFLGAEDSVYTRGATRASILGAVKRIFHPGCKFDEALTLVGPQGIGKSTILRKLGKDKWFSDSLSAFTDKDAIEQLPGNWIIELGEMAALNKSEAEQAKAFLSKQVDKCRPAYGRVRVDRPRQCVFFGTTNDDEFLRDSTGDRRFWPINVTGDAKLSVWDDLTDYYVDQIWAEAVARLRGGEDVLLSNEEKKGAAKSQAEHKEGSQLRGLIEEYLSIRVPPDWNKETLPEKRSLIDSYRYGGYDPEDSWQTIDRICVRTVIHEVIGKPLDYTPNRSESNRIMSILRGLDGFSDAKVLNFGTVYGKQKGFLRENFTDN